MEIPRHQLAIHTKIVFDANPSSFIYPYKVIFEHPLLFAQRPFWISRIEYPDVELLSKFDNDYFKDKEQIHLHHTYIIQLRYLGIDNCDAFCYGVSPGSSPNPHSLAIENLHKLMKFNNRSQFLFGKVKAWQDMIFSFYGP